MRGPGAPLFLRLAWRELRGGVAGFRIFLACLALGVGAIAAVGSMTAAFEAGIAEERQVLLGGDIEVELTHRPASPAERAFLEGLGAVSEILQMRAILRLPDGSAQSLVELKSVDGAYPLYGRARLDGEGGLAAALAPREVDGESLPGLVIEQTLRTRLGLAIGDRAVLGTRSFEVRDVLRAEPDRLAGGFKLGPRIIVSTGALRETGLVQLGSLIEYRYRVKLPASATNAEVGAAVDALRAAFPTAEWRLGDRRTAGRSLTRDIDTVAVFLTFVGLTALVVGGVGVGNAVAGYLDRKRAAIAIFKTLGAEGGTIFAVYLAQILALAGLGILIGIALGAIGPLIGMRLLADVLPVPARGGIYPLPLLLAAGYGLLTALAFSLWPLARAREVPAASLFRDLVAPVRRMPRPAYLLAVILAFAGLAGTALLFTDNRAFAAWFLVGAGAVFAVLYGTARGLKALARRLARGRRAGVRIALANLHRPGAPTGPVVLSLGLGFTLLVTVTLIDGTVAARIENQLPEGAPAFFFVDIQPAQLEPFLALARSTPGISNIETVANLRGRIAAIDGVPAREAEIDPEGRWALRGDRGITYEARKPDNITVVAGTWWPEDYAGPPLLSMDAELARQFGVGLGDRLTLNILGREITFEIANLRRLDWDRLGLNFLFIVSPGVLEAAPHAFLATLSASEEAEVPFQSAVLDAFPNITAVRVKEALGTLTSILEDLSLAVRAASAVTLVAGLLVLAGALAAGRRQRLYDAVLFKVLGATRAKILRLLALEYAMLGLATALIAAGAGTLAAYVVVTEAMGLSWSWLPATLGGTILLAAGVTLVLGLAGTFHALSARPAESLRHA
ncbi:MAG: ABC transporter permease [Alphaproteobacteria bacterium]|nr:ABC transporter permease [Alphaproteobacteria bacterium]